MNWFSALKTALASGAKEINKEYGKTEDFLKAVCASVALVIFADGTAEDSEKKQGIDVLTGHTQLSALYSRPQIENSLNDALRHGTTASGRQELARALDRVLTLPNGTEMADDVFLMAVDVASSNSEHKVREQEQGVLDKISARLHVDPKKFQF
jgi:tellurite resistance protein TerB